MLRIKSYCEARWLKSLRLPLFLNYDSFPEAKSFFKIKYFTSILHLNLKEKYFKPLMSGRIKRSYIVTQSVILIVDLYELLLLSTIKRLFYCVSEKVNV